MRRSPRLLLLAALALATVACKSSDSILFVTVYGPRSVEATEFDVIVSAGSPSVAHFITVKKDTEGETIGLPASFTIALDRSYSGPITISINADATDSMGNLNILASGTTMMQHIQIGGQTDIAVDLGLPLPPGTPDGGTDGPVGGGSGSGGEGGAGGSGGAGGAAGTGGASGQGGAAGSDGGPPDGDDAMGLDGATD